MIHEPSPREFMAADTERFLVDALPPPGAARSPGGAEPGAARPRLLEVGAGDGRLAARLAARGWDVTAIEPDAKRAGLARGRGVRVAEADFLDADALPREARFEVVFFSRVLHHLDPLERAIERADARLAPGGLVAGEEFAWERADDAAIHWLAGTRAEATRRGLLPDEPDPARESLAAWRRHHSADHRVHRGDAVLAALAARFEIVWREDPAYLFRYLCSRLVDSPEAAAYAAEIREAEARAIAAGTLSALGLRFVARRAGG